MSCRTVVRHRSLALFVGCALLLPAGASAADEPLPINGWFYHLPAAQAAARKTGKPIFAVVRCEA